MDQREKFEAWAGSKHYNLICYDGSVFYESHTTNTVWESWQAAIAAQEPKQAMTEPEIESLMLAAFPRTKCSQAYIALARAIERASSPNKDLVEALLEYKRLYEEVQPAGGWQGVYEMGNAALRAAGVEAA